MEFVYTTGQNIILLLLATGTFYSWRLVVNRKKNMVFLAVYMSANLIAEFWVKKIFPQGVVNHYIYAANILVHSTCLLTYIFLQPQKKMYRLFPVLSFMYFFSWYFINGMWKKSALFSVNDFTNYYGILSVCSIVWVWITVKSKSGSQHSYALYLAACFLFYHVLGLVNNSISSIKVIVSPVAKQYFIWAPFVIIVAFYSALLVLLIKMNNSLKNK